MKRRTLDIIFAAGGVVVAVLLLVLGVWLPAPLKGALDAATLVVRGHP